MSSNFNIENQNLKQEISKYKQILGKIPYIDDSLLKGGYRVVRNLKERDAIPYCYRKYGMKVVVVGNEEDGLFREYILNSENLLNVWKEVTINVPITEVFEETVQLTEDYSELAEDLETQRELNIVLKTLILQLQQDVQNIEIPTNTSELINDGEDGVNPFITAQDIPTPIPQVNADWNATSGVAEILNKPTIPAPVDVSTKAETDASNLSATNVISWRTALDVYSKSEVDTALTLKLDKPTTDGSWVVTKSGTTITYTDASTFGQNISNSNLTWNADRTQNLNAKKLSFTGGRVSVPALEFGSTVISPINNTISVDGTDVWYTNSLGIAKKVPRVESNPTIDKISLLTPTGNLKPISLNFGLISKVYGEDSAGVPVFNDTVQIKDVDTSNTPPTILELVEKGVDRVDYPNLNRIYFNYGVKWGYITLTELTI